MPQSFQEVAVAEPESDQALAIMFGLNGSGQAAHASLQESDKPMSVQELADNLDCALTTAYRIVDTLVTHRLAESKTIKDSTCQRSVYEAADPVAVAERMEAQADRAYTDCRAAIEGVASIADKRVFHA